jgi:hypothetical protein
MIEGKRLQESSHRIIKAVLAAILFPPLHGHELVLE